MKGNCQNRWLKSVIFLRKRDPIPRCNLWLVWQFGLLSLLCPLSHSGWLHRACQGQELPFENSDSLVGLGFPEPRDSRAMPEPIGWPEPSGPLDWLPDGPASKSSGIPADSWQIKLGGHIQMDYVMWPDADPSIVDSRNYFNYRRLRLVADGVGYRVFDFRLQMTLEPGEGLAISQVASPDVKDAYVSINEIPLLGRIRVGNFFVPFSLEQVTNDTNNIFTERSIPTQGVFAADREVGMALYNQLEERRITWSTGVFFDNINDTLKTRIDNNQGYRLAGRLTWLPYFDEASEGRYLVHTGIGILHTQDHDNLLRFGARPQIQRGPIVIDSGFLPGESHTTGNLELAVVWGPLTLQAEGFLCTPRLADGNRPVLGGAYAHLSWFLTGENRKYERFGQHGAQFGRNQPFQNLLGNQQGHNAGAWEAKIRWSHFDLQQLSSGRYDDLTVGLNWYWSDRTRMMLDWIHPITSPNTVFGATESDILALRFDVNW